MTEYAAPTDAMIGTLLDGKYRILSFLGAGGMASVYKAEHVLLHRLCAVKVMHTSCGEIEAVQRFQLEAASLTRLSHPNVLKIYSFGLTEANRPYLVMEFLNGQSLADRLALDGALNIAECLDIFRQVLAGIACAHAEGVIHRDLKPHNIFLCKPAGENSDDDPVVKVVDFGLAKIYSEGEAQQKLTRTGVLLGTPLYMSPEQTAGLPPRESTDIYAIGCSMYETLTGKTPFQGESFLSVAFQHMNDEVPPMSAPAGASIPAGVQALVRQSLAKNPDSRYESAKEFAEVLVAVSAAPDVVPQILQDKLKQKDKTVHSAKSISAKPTKPAWLAPVLLLMCSLVLFFASIQLWSWYQMRTVRAELDAANQAATDGKYEQANQLSADAVKRAGNKSTDDVAMAHAFQQMCRKVHQAYGGGMMNTPLAADALPLFERALPYFENTPGFQPFITNYATAAGWWNSELEQKNVRTSRPDAPEYYYLLALKYAPQRVDEQNLSPALFLHRWESEHMEGKLAARVEAAVKQELQILVDQGVPADNDDRILCAINLSRLASGRHDYKAAEKYLQLLPSSFRDKNAGLSIIRAAAIIELAERLFMIDKDFKGVARVLRPLIQDHELYKVEIFNAPRAYFLEGAAILQMAEPAQAVLLLRQALVEKGASRGMSAFEADGRGMLGLALLRTGDYSEAKVQLAKSISLYRKILAQGDKNALHSLPAVEQALASCETHDRK